MHVDQLENGTFSVKYIQSHTGHDIGPTELSHLPLPNSVKEEIATKINLGIRKERIILLMVSCSTILSRPSD